MLLFQHPYYLRSTIRSAITKLEKVLHQDGFILRGIESQENLADLFTKILARVTRDDLVDKMMIRWSKKI